MRYTVSLHYEHSEEKIIATFELLEYAQIFLKKWIALHDNKRCVYAIFDDDLIIQRINPEQISVIDALAEDNLNVDEMLFEVEVHHHTDSSKQELLGQFRTIEYATCFMLALGECQREGHPGERWMIYKNHQLVETLSLSMLLNQQRLKQLAQNNIQDKQFAPTPLQMDLKPPHFPDDPWRDKDK